jgi:CHAT domain-containing protein
MGAPALVYMATKDTLLTWLVLPSGEVALERQAIARDSVAAFVAAIRGHLGADEAIGRTLRSIESRAVPSGPGAPTTRARAMTSAERFETSASALIPPGLAARLPAGGELVIVPHGPLALVAFAALPIGSQPVGLGAREALGSRYAIRYAPSLTTLRVVTARAGATERAGTGTRVAALRGALVVGNPMMPRVRVARGGSVRLPALPAAGREGRWVAQALGVRSLTGRLATERAVRDRMAKAPVIHLATHGFAYSADARALDSFVALAPDSLAGAEGNGLLTVGEVIEDAPHLTADLVVLSACQTGLGNLRQAEGTVGLQRAFLAKGARSVLVSLWSVSDEATELLMRRFYTHWLHDTDEPSKAEALRRAQGDVRRTPKFSDPRFWAAFQLVGAR